MATDRALFICPALAACILLAHVRVHTPLCLLPSPLLCTLHARAGHPSNSQTCEKVIIGAHRRDPLGPPQLSPRQLGATTGTTSGENGPPGPDYSLSLVREGSLRYPHRAACSMARVPSPHLDAAVWRQMVMMNDVDTAVKQEVDDEPATSSPGNMLPSSGGDMHKWVLSRGNRPAQRRDSNVHLTAKKKEGVSAKCQHGKYWRAHGCKACGIKDKRIKPEHIRHPVCVAHGHRRCRYCRPEKFCQHGKDLSDCIFCNTLRSKDCEPISTSDEILWCMTVAMGTRTTRENDQRTGRIPRAP